MDTHIFWGVLVDFQNLQPFVLIVNLLVCIFNHFNLRLFANLVYNELKKLVVNN